MENFEREIDLTKRNYTKIQYGTSSLKNIDKIYNTYHIPRDESIVATATGSMSFFGFGFDGTIITNKAIYFHPDNNRYPYSEICKYIVSQSDNKSDVVLIDAETSHSRCHRSTAAPRESSLRSRFWHLHPCRCAFNRKDPV